MTKLEVLAAKHYATLTDHGAVPSMDTERAIRAALRDWTEECVGVVERTLLVHPWQARRIADLLRVLAWREEEA